MIPAILYNAVYLLVITILTVVKVGHFNNTAHREEPSLCILLCVALIAFIGFRPHSPVFIDTMNYVISWGIAYFDGFDTETPNLLFDNLYLFMSWSGIDITWFFVLIAAIYFSGMLMACRKLFPCNTTLAFLVCVAAFSTFSYGTNGIKAGAAASLFLVALAYRDKFFVSIIFLLLSWGFHHSMQLPVAAYILSMFLKKDKWYFYGWMFCLLMALLHITFFQVLLGGMTDEGGAGYLIKGLDSDWGGKQGFRFDFVLYSAVPIALGYYVKKHKIVIDSLYDFILHVYLVCNGIWMLCMYASFTNRIAYLSWSMAPIVLIYPYFKLKNSDTVLPTTRKTVILGNIGFTLFMHFIYYA